VAWRRRPVADPAGQAPGGGLPTEVLRCVADDWLDAAFDLPDWWARATDAVEVNLLRRAQERWRVARSDWAAAQGLDPAQLPAGRPVWADGRPPRWVAQAATDG
jgi:hypothetical protein